MSQVSQLYSVYCPFRFFVRGDPLGRQHGPAPSAVEVLQDAVANAQKTDAICLQEQRTKHTGNK